LSQDGFREVKRIQDHLGLENSDERLQAIVKRCSLHNLKTDVNENKMISHLKDANGKSVLNRKGEINNVL